MKPAIIFDVGGVLVTHDMEGLFSWVKDRTGVDISLLHKKFAIKRDLSEIDEHEFFTSLSLKGIDEKEFFDAMFSSFTSVDWELLDFIKNDLSEYEVFVFSNNSKVNIDNYGIDFSISEACVFSYEIKKRKPSLEFFTYALKKIGKRAEECIFIDDAKDNCDSAGSLGIRTILYLGLEDLKEKLKEYTNKK